MENLVLFMIPDEVTDDGRPYWTGTKRFPTELNFDIKNPLHVDFIVAAANLRAFNFQLVKFVHKMFSI